MASWLFDVSLPTSLGSLGPQARGKGEPGQLRSALWGQIWSIRMGMLDVWPKHRSGSSGCVRLAVPCLSSGRACESSHKAHTVAQASAIKIPVESPLSIFSCVACTGIAALRCSRRVSSHGAEVPLERDRRSSRHLLRGVAEEEPVPRCSGGKAGLSARKGR